MIWFKPEQPPPVGDQIVSLVVIGVIMLTLLLLAR